jgi:CxxC motif-containing protein (DUF1111 family)
MRIAIVGAVLAVGMTSIAALPVAEEAATGFEARSNGAIDELTYQADKAVFDDVEKPEDGLGPLYNAQSCRECHQDPISGGGSQVTELRIGHHDSLGRFVAPDMPIAGGQETIKARSLVNDRAVCPSGAFPNGEIHQYTPETETVRTTRLSISLLGDGFIEAVADQTLINLAAQQCRVSGRKICGQVLRVPIVEAAPGTTGVGRFGWKGQHASLVSFAGDAYLNEMGVTSKNFPNEVTNICGGTTAQPNDEPDADGMDDVIRFARFIRATQAPARNREIADSADGRHGAELFKSIGCVSCHVDSMTTAPEGTVMLGGTYTVPHGVGNKIFHPYSDLLLHDVGTGDGIVQTAQEHFGRQRNMKSTISLMPAFSSTQNKIRTPPLWGVRLRTRLMHDGNSFTYSDAILRHENEASVAKRAYFRLSAPDRAALLLFLRSL